MSRIWIGSFYFGNIRKFLAHPVRIDICTFWYTFFLKLFTLGVILYYRLNRVFLLVSPSICLFLCLIVIIVLCLSHLFLICQYGQFFLLVCNEKKFATYGGMTVSWVHLEHGLLIRISKFVVLKEPHFSPNIGTNLLKSYNFANRQHNLKGS